MSDATKKAEKIELAARERWGIIEALGIRGTLDKLAFGALNAKDGARVVDVRWSKDGKDFAVRLVQKPGELGYGQVPGKADRAEMRKRLLDEDKHDEQLGLQKFDLVAFVLERRFRDIPVSFEAWEEWEARTRAELAPKAEPKPAAEAEPLAAE